MANCERIEPIKNQGTNKSAAFLAMERVKKMKEEQVASAQAGTTNNPYQGIPLWTVPGAKPTYESHVV
ncbi:hypothetical protein IJF81_04195 [bacterium]|nr:hypothetical protein [bacterium]